METITSIEHMKAVSKELKAGGKRIGFVLTMGFLHEGHLSLVRESIKRTDSTVVSIFVNPSQFGPREDFKEYPRDLERDKALLEKEGVDYLFCPGASDMYPEGYKTHVEVHDLQDRLCGRNRPGHFRGVCTVVLKLFNIVGPDIAFFGAKDAQQAVILQKMVRDLNLDIRIEVLPIVRDKDGLALSSRNAYLAPEERRAALVLTRSLEEAKMWIAGGERDAGRITGRIKSLIEKEPAAEIDYVDIVDLEELNPVKTIEKEALIALAVHIGKTRLIDNLTVRIEGKTR